MDDCREGLFVTVKRVFHLASALKHMHSQQLVHQDLHSRNVLSSLDGQSLKVVDLGAASFTHCRQGKPVVINWVQ